MCGRVTGFYIRLYMCQVRLDKKSKLTKSKARIPTLTHCQQVASALEVKRARMHVRLVLLMCGRVTGFCMRLYMCQVRLDKKIKLTIHSVQFGTIIRSSSP